MARILRYTAIGLGALVLVILLFINQGLAGIAASLYPGSSPYVFAGLLVLEAVAVLWFWRGVFGRQQHLRFAANPTPEQRQRFARELALRMRANPLLRDANLDPSAPDYMEQCLAVLRKKSDEEIRSTAERIFLATALAQNGRIDALIVFISLCRLVWRISGIYNQRPHPAEVTSLYWAVATSTFLALSFEELDISTEITVGFGEAFHAMAPATMTGGVPFVGTALQKFTASAIDGAANCFLALRAGIVTRNAFAYTLEDKEQPRRVNVYKEAGGILFEMSETLIAQFTKGLGECLWGLGRAAHHKTVQAGQNIAEGALRVGGNITNGAGKVASATLGAVQNTGGVILHAGQATGSAVKQAGGAVATAALKTGQVAEAALRTGQNLAGATLKTGQAVVDVAAKTGQTVAQTGKTVADAAVATGEAVAGTTVKTGKAVARATLNTGKSVAGIVLKTGRAVSAPFRGRRKNRKNTTGTHEK